MKIVYLNDVPKGEVSHNPKVRKQQVFAELGSGKVVNFSQAYFPPGEKAPAHAHEDMAEIFMVQSGEGEITLNGQSFDLSPGMYILVEPGDTHEIYNNGKETLVMGYFGIMS
jgi:mannose-6-phosphate isomerase-like protein (cupin superfamily)